MKNKNPIELDRWESQLVLYGKHHLKDPNPDVGGLFNMHQMPLEQVLKNLWGNRCGIQSKHIDLKHMAFVLLRICVKVGVFENIDYALTEFLSNAGPQSSWTQDGHYTDNNGFYLRICWVCLFTFLSTLHVRDKDEKTQEWVDYITFTPFEPNLLLVCENDKEEENLNKI